MTAAKARTDLLKVRWSAAEDEVLRREWPTYARMDDILARLPGRSRGSTGRRAFELGLKRPADRPHPGKVVSVHIVREGVEGKACTKCLAWQPLESFRAMTRGKWFDGRNTRCKGCEGEYQKTPERKAWHAENYVKHATEIQARVRAWQLANPEKDKANRRRMSAKRRGWKGEGPGITAAQITFLFEAYGFRCAYCGAPAETLDHVHPLALGGEHSFENQVPACISCNSRKGKMLPADWEKKLYGETR